jgi:hypothetical protein
MRGRNMSDLLAPLERLFTLGRAKTIGIGDGGNEVGMGKVSGWRLPIPCCWSRDRSLTFPCVLQVKAKILASSIPNASQIHCVTPADHLIVASVSNWGGYALAAALALAAAEVRCAGETPPSKHASHRGSWQDGRMSRAEAVRRLLVSEADERALIDRMVQAGARDGITREVRGGRPLPLSAPPKELNCSVIGTSSGPLL